MKSGLIAGIGTLLMLVAALAQAERHGEMRDLEHGEVAAFDANRAAWVSPDAFWQAYVVESPGRTWGSRSDYPAFEDVREGDTLLIQLESGPCLMEFFHSRWRRANDVRRWDPGFNEYGGCPKVFD